MHFHDSPIIFDGRLDAGANSYVSWTGKICMFRNNGAQIGSRRLEKTYEITGGSSHRIGNEDFDVTFARENHNLMIARDFHRMYTYMVGINCTEKF